MDNAVKPKARGRKRRREPDVPCSDCIRRASESKHKGGVGLCEVCSVVLGRSQPLKLEIPEQRPRPIKQARRSTTTPHDKDDRVDSAREIDLQVPAEFLSLREAQVYLVPIHNRLASLILHAEAKSPLHRKVVSNEERRLHFSPWLDLWEAAFTKYLSKYIATFNEPQHQAAMTLKAHHLMAESFAKVPLVGSRFVWEGLHKNFKAILDLASGVLSMSLSPARPDDAATELNIFDPLYEVWARSSSVPYREAAGAMLSKIRPEQFTFSASTNVSPSARYLQKQPVRSASHNGSYGGRSAVVQPD